jgi:hypothetical protein
VLAVNELPAVQRVLLHGGDHEGAVGRKGNGCVCACPFELDRLALGGREMQRHAVVAGNPDAHAFRRESDAFDGARMLELSCFAVRETDVGTAPDGEGDCTLRSGRDAGHPLATDLGQDLDGAFDADRRDFAVLAAGNQSRLRRVDSGCKQPVMGTYGLVAEIEPVHRAIGQREEGHAGNEDSGNAMTFEVERGEGGHGRSNQLSG